MGFKERFTQLRKELELTQEQLAEKLGMGYTRTAISAWEVGRNEPSNSDTVKIAEFFGVSTDYLLGKTDIRQPVTQKDFEKHLLNSKFAEKYNKLTDEQKKTLDSLVEVWEKENKNN